MASFACVVFSFNCQLDTIWKRAPTKDCLEKVALLASGQSVRNSLSLGRPTVGVTIPLVEASELCKWRKQLSVHALILCLLLTVGVNSCFMFLLLWLPCNDVAWNCELLSVYFTMATG